VQLISNHNMSKILLSPHSQHTTSATLTAPHDNDDSYYYHLHNKNYYVIMLAIMPLTLKPLQVSIKRWITIGVKLFGITNSTREGPSTELMSSVGIWDTLEGLFPLICRNSSPLLIMTVSTVILTVTFWSLIPGGLCPTSFMSCSDIGNWLSSSLFHMMKRYSLITFQMPITFEQTSDSDSRNLPKSRPRPISRWNLSQGTSPEYVLAPLARSESKLRIQERERTEQGRRIISVGNRRVVQPRRGPTPPPSYAADRRAALCEHWRLHLDVIAEGEVAADIQPDLEQNGLPSTGGVWTQYIQGVSEEFYVELRHGIRHAAHLDSHLSKEYGGTVVQAVVLAYQRCLQDTPFPLSTNPFLAPEEGQVREQVGEDNALVYPENPQVHWAFHGSYVLPSAKLHIYLTPHAQANFIGKDLPSLHYEDPALATISAFWIDAAPEIYQPASRWWHPLYAAHQFSGAIPTLRDWHNWLEVNFWYTWKQRTRQAQYSIPACMERPSLLFEESRDLWVAHTTLICLDMADYQNGAFLFHGLQPHWPSSQDQCDDLALLHDRHEAG